PTVPTWFSSLVTPLVVTFSPVGVHSYRVVYAVAAASVGSRATPCGFPCIPPGPFVLSWIRSFPAPRSESSSRLSSRSWLVGVVVGGGGVVPASPLDVPCPGVRAAPNRPDLPAAGLQLADLEPPGPGVVVQGEPDVRVGRVRQVQPAGLALVDQVLSLVEGR